MRFVCNSKKFRLTYIVLLSLISITIFTNKNLLASKNYETTVNIDEPTNVFATRCHPFYLRNVSKIAIIDIESKVEINTKDKNKLSVKSQTVCICNEKFKNLRTGSDPCAADDLSKDGSGICDRNMIVNNMEIAKFDFGDGLLISTKKHYNPWPKDNQYYDKTVVVLIYFQVLPDTKKKKDEFTVTTTTSFRYKYSVGVEEKIDTYTTKTTTHYKYNP